jgi:hypothetical protein
MVFSSYYQLLFHKNLVMLLYTPYFSLFYFTLPNYSTSSSLFSRVCKVQKTSPAPLPNYITLLFLTLPNYCCLDKITSRSIMDNWHLPTPHPPAHLYVQRAHPSGNTSTAKSRSIAISSNTIWKAAWVSTLWGVGFCDDLLRQACASSYASKRDDTLPVSMTWAINTATDLGV